MPEAELRFFIEIRGVGPSDFRINEEGPEKQDEAVAVANDVHDILREEYEQTDVTGVVPVVDPDVHEKLVDGC